MNLIQLKAAVAAYHSVEVEELTQGPVDLFLVALNNVRKKAEKRHNFGLTRCTGVLDIDGVNGGSLSDATIMPANMFSGIKEVIALSGLNVSQQFVPLDFTRADIEIERERYEIELSNNFWPTDRYPSDADVLRNVGAGTLVMRGNTIYNFPRMQTSAGNVPLTVYIEGYGWLLDYTDDDLDGNIDELGPKDFLVEHGFEFLQWATIIELNWKFQTFVPRQEGNVGSPEAMRQEAWKDLLLWDTYQDVNLTRSR